VTVWLAIGAGIFMLALGVVTVVLVRRRGGARRSAITGSSIFFLIGAALVIVGGVSASINAHRQVDVCKVSAVTSDPTRSGASAWDVASGCSGALYIDPGATGQTVAAATALANSMSPGQTYRLTIQGELGNPFGISSYLLAARPVGP
jgi:hypothetical protein